MKYGRTWGWLSVLILLVAGFFYQTILYQKLPVPSDTLVGLYHPWRDTFAREYPRGVPFKNFLITDPIRQQIPWKKIVIDSWKAGTRPGWNPYSFAGVPLDANNQAAPYYPLNLLFFLFEFPVAWTLLIILQPMLAGIFFYLYVRRLNISAIAACTGAVVWAFSGFAVSWLTWGTIMHTALWLPLVLLGIDMLSERKKLHTYYVRWSAILSFAAAMILLGGHIQVAMYVLLLSAAYSYRMWKQAADRSAFRWILISIGVAGVVTAIQWIPFVRYLAESGRVAAAESWKMEGWFLPWQHLIQFIAPDFFGNPATLNYWGVWNYGEFIGYIGVIPLLFAISAVGMAGTPGFFAIAAAISLFIMLPSPLSKLVFELHIPIVSVLQPTRLMVLVDFSLAVLASFGIDQLLKGERKRVQRSMVFYGIGLAGLWVAASGIRFMLHNNEALSESFAVARRNLVLPTAFFTGMVLWLGVFRRAKRLRSRQAWVVVLMCMVVFDLFRFGWKFTPFTPLAYFFPTTKIISFLQSQNKPFRVMTLDDRILPPNVSGYYGIETIEGYDPIAPLRYEDFLVASERGTPNIVRPTGFKRIYTAYNIDSILLPYFNVRYVLSLTDQKQPYLREIMREGETRVYEYTRALPRAYLADSTKVLEKPADVLSELFANTDSLLGVYDGKSALMNIPLSADETVEITDYAASTIALNTKTKSSRLLVILNRYDPRWSAEVDGKSVPLFPVNYLFTGMEVPSGTHDVILTFR